MRIVLDFYLYRSASVNGSIEQCSVPETFILQDMRRDLVFEANNDNKLVCRFYTGHYYNSAVDITGYKFYFTIKDKPTDLDANAVYTQDVTSLTDPTNGEAEIEVCLASGQTFEGNFLYELKAKTSSGKIRTLCYGILTYRIGLSSRT